MLLTMDRATYRQDVTVGKQHAASDDGWADRCNYWLKTTAPKSRKFIAKAGVRQPLILTGHGVSLRVEKGSLLVRRRIVGVFDASTSPLLH
jgi:hypothetical protein